MDQIPFVDLKAQYASLKAEVDEAVLRVMGNCNFILGREVEEFEQNFAAYLEVDHALGVSSGLDALRLALEALGVGRGDEVILPANTFIATALAVSSVGAMPVLVDMEERGYNIDPNQIEDAITSRTRAIMPVHLYGQPCDLDAVLEIARRRGLKVIEDACQAHGARYKGRRAGTIGDVGCFSFYPGKNLGAYGDGGAVVTADGELAEKMTRLRNYGQQKKYYHSEKGLNARLDTMQAAVLGVKLKYLDEWNRRRAAHAARYKELLKVVEQVALPETLPDRDHIFHLFVIRVQERDRLQQYLAEKGVSALIHYPIPIHLQEAYTELGYTERAFPATERAAREILSLPMYSELRPEQIERVSSAVTDFFYRQS